MIESFEHLFHLNPVRFWVLFLLLMLLLGGTLGFIVYLVYSLTIAIHNRVLRNYVYKNSTAIRALVHFNTALPSNHFVSIQCEYDYFKSANSRRKFQYTSHRDLLKEYYLENFEYFEKAIKIFQENRVKYRLYKRQCDVLFKTRSTDWYGTRNYEKKELECFTMLMLKPDIDLTITTHCEYISPAGRNEYYSKDTFNLSDLISVQEEVKRQREFESSKQYQRSKMTDSLRYDIMKRDGFACVLCGATKSDGAKLHVDHILPIAKGGKTDPSNLRTLCDRCNQGKRDKYDPDGLN